MVGDPLDRDSDYYRLVQGQDRWWDASDSASINSKSSGGGWTWTGNWKATSSLSAGQWNTITVQVPNNAVTPFAQLGVEFATNASWTGAAYVDAVSW